MVLMGELFGAVCLFLFMVLVAEWVIRASDGR